MKTSKRFIRDFNWLLSVRHQFCFSGSNDMDIEFSKSGLDGRMAFYVFDSTGKVEPTKHPNLFRSILRTKASANLHIKMYAEGRADGTLPKFDFLTMCENINAPEWFFEAVERQKIRIIGKSDLPKWYKQSAVEVGVTRELI